MRRNTQPIGPRFGPPWRRNTAHSAGDKVSAFNAEISIATLIVTANCRNNVPEMPGMKAIGTNTESRTNVIATIGAVISAIAFLVASAGDRFGFFLHDAFDVLDHDDRVVDQDADRQHHREQRDRIGRIAHHQQHREGADHADRHRDCRNEGRAQAAEKHEDDDHDQHKGDQRA